MRAKTAYLETQNNQVFLTSYSVWHLAYEAAVRSETAWKSVEGEGSNDPLASVILAYTSIETFVAEVGEILNAHRPMGSIPSSLLEWGDLLSELDEIRARLISHLRIIGRAFPDANERGYDTDIDPIQSVLLLGRLRNEIVHRDPDAKKPKWFCQFEAKSLAVDHVPAAAQKNHNHQYTCYWLWCLTNPMVALWACETAKNLMLDVAARMTRSTNPGIGFWGTAFSKRFTVRNPD